MTFDDADSAGDASAMFGSALPLEMGVRTGGALELTDALWEIVPIVVAAGERYDETSPVEAADSTPAAQRLSEETRTRIREQADQGIANVNAVLDTQTWDEKAVVSVTAADAQANPFGIVGSLFDLEAMAGALRRGLTQAPQSADELMYLRVYLVAATRARRTPLLLRALLVAAVRSLEPLVTRMVHILLQHADPQTYPTLADPKLDVAARKLCSGPPMRWRDVLTAKCGVAKAASAIDWSRIEQLWNDRSAIAHRAGVIDARHSKTSGLDIGTVIALDAASVQAAIDDVAAARLAVVLCAWDHMQPGIAAKFAETTVFYTDSLRAGRWRQAAGLSRLLMAFASDAENIAVAKVNGWLAAEQGFGSEHIRADVEAWDTSSLPNSFKMARLLLLHQDDEALDELAALLESGEVVVEELKDWPLFDRLRNDARFVEFVSRD